MSAALEDLSKIPDHRLIGELNGRGYDVQDAEPATSPRPAGGPIELVAAGDVAADNLSLLVRELDESGWAATKEYQGEAVVVFNVFPSRNGA